MRGPLFYAGFCLLLLGAFAYTKRRGLEYWPGTSTTNAYRGGSGSGSSGSSSGGRGGGGGFFGSSSSHK